MTHITEKQLEDYICENPESLFGPGTEVIGRQISLPHGRLDVLMWAGYGETVVLELKARPLEEKDIGQILRYTYDVVEILSEYGCKYSLVREGEYPTLQQSIAIDYWDKLTCRPRTKYKLMSSWLIGTKINERTMAAATAARLNVATWMYNPCQSSFSIEFKPEEQSEISSHPDWIAPLLRRITGWANERSEQEAWFAIRDFFRSAYVRHQESKERGEGRRGRPE